MTPARQPHPDDLFLITREELDRCCSQMSAAGYKVSANYIEALVLSRPHTSPQAPRPPCEECIYQAQAASAAKAERERENQRVLDSMKQFVDSGYYTGFAASQTERILWKIESLRAQPEQGGVSKCHYK